MRKLLVLFLILFLAIFIRLYQIESVPACMNWDEAAFGYNAYSILQTGRDEYGMSFPLEFMSIGDFKFPGYIYLTVPVIKLFGLSVFSVRFLPAFLGALSVVPMYLLTRRIINENTAILSSLFLAISPWHIQFTRAGADVGVSTFFVITGIYLFVRSAHEKDKDFILPAISFSMAIYTYFTDRVFVPLIVVAMSVLFRRQLFGKFRKVFVGIVYGLIVLIPLFLTVLSSGQQSKLFGTTVFGQVRGVDYVESLDRDDSGDELQIFHNGFYEKVLGVADHYFSHFSFSFLFAEGASFDMRQIIYQMGLMYVYELPLIILGLVYLYKSKNMYLKFILVWLLIAPIPSAITRDPVHARRSINMVYPLLIFSAVGAERFFNFLNKWRGSVKYGFSFVVMSAFLFSVFWFLVSYFIFTPKRVLAGPAGFNCGHKELVEYVYGLEKDYDRVVVDPAYQGPYLYFLFYNKYPPEKYQPQAELWFHEGGGLGEGTRIDNIEFRPIYWPDDRGLTNTLFAAPPERLPAKDVVETGRILKKIYFYNGELAYVVVATQ